MSVTHSLRPAGAWPWRSLPASLRAVHQDIATMVQIVELDDRAGDDLSIFRKAPEAGSSTREPTASATAPTSEQQPSVAAAHDRDAPQEPTTAEASSKEDTAGPNPTSDPEQDESLQEPIEAFTDEEREAMLAKADALKQEGNTLYGQGAYDEAIDKYSDALEAGGHSHAHFRRAACQRRQARQTRLASSHTAQQGKGAGFRRLLFRAGEVTGCLGVITLCALQRPGLPSSSVPYTSPT